jgi:hypothetical protein
MALQTEYYMYVYTVENISIKFAYYTPVAVINEINTSIYNSRFIVFNIINNLYIHPNPLNIN